METRHVKEFVKNNIDVKIMDVNENSIEVTNVTEDDLDEIDDAGLGISKVTSDWMGIKVEDEDVFRDSYNDWIDGKKI